MLIYLRISVMDWLAGFATLLLYTNGIEAVPPDACFHEFRWDDCGKPPQPVIYYWKPGSRCEIGMWRGCLPNYNMFKDEYECVSTCIFSVRARADDYHNFYKETVPDETEEPDYFETTLAIQGNQTVVGNSTAVESATTVAGGSGNSTDAGGAATGGTAATGGDSTGGATGTGAPADGTTNAEAATEAPA